MGPQPRSEVNVHNSPNARNMYGYRQGIPRGRPARGCGTLWAMQRRALIRVRDRAEQRGIKVPVRLDPAGRVETVQGDEQVRSLLRRALGDCSNTNAFRQGLGLGVDPVLRVKTPALVGLIRSRVSTIIRRDFAGRVELVGVEILTGSPGELETLVRYRTITGLHELTVGG